MKRFALAIALACALSGSALAGDIATPGAPAPGDQGNGGVVGDEGAGGVVGDMGSGGVVGDMGNGGAAVLLTILDLVF